MASVDYPEGLPLALNNGLSYTWNSPTVETSPAKGPPIVEKWTDDQSNVYSLTWSMTEFQLRAFLGWYYQKLNNGSLWFNMQVPWSGSQGGDVREQECNFAGNVPDISHNGKRRQVTVDVVIRTPFRDDEGDVDSLLALAAEVEGNPEDFLLQLEQFANEDMPGSLEP